MSEPAQKAGTHTEPPIAMRGKLLPKLLLSLALGGVFGWLYQQGGSPLIPTREAFAHLTWWAIPVYVVTLVATHWFRATRWRFLIAPVKRLPLREVVALNWIGFFAIFALPLRLGELARPAIAKMRNGISISAGFGTIAVERVIDGLLMSGCVAWALFAMPIRDHDDPIAAALPFYGYLSLVVFSAAFVGLALFLWQRDLAVRLTLRVGGLVSKRLAGLVSQKIGTLADGVRSIGNPKLALPFLGETILYWGCNAFGMWILGVGCGIPMTFGHAIAVMGILAIGILLPAGPGLFGNFQLAISTALSLYFAAELVDGEGAVYIFVMYVVQAVVITLAGVVPLLAMRIPLRALFGGTVIAKNLATDRMGT